MIVKEFKPKKALWGFKVDFVDRSYGVGYDIVHTMLGDIKAQDGKKRWFMEADVPYPMSVRSAALNDPHHHDLKRWKKGRIYVNDEDLAMMLRLMCQ